MTTSWIRAVVVVGLVAWIAGCGGGGGETSAPAAPAPTAGPPTIGAAGGTASDASGASVVVPAGALATDTTIRVAMDSNGAPVLPEGPLASAVYAITPHGAQFKQAVSVTLPYNAALLPAGTEPAIAKAEPGGPWNLIPSSVNGNGTVTAQISGFSYFIVVPAPRSRIVNALLPELRVRYISSDNLNDWVLAPNQQVSAEKRLLRPADLAVEITLVNAPVCNTGWRTDVETSRMQGSAASVSYGQYIADEVTGNYWVTSHPIATNGVIRIELPWNLLNRVNDRANQFVRAVAMHPYCQDAGTVYFPAQPIFPDVHIYANTGTRRISISRHPANVTAAAGQAVVFETDIFQSGPGPGDNRVRVEWLRAEAGSALFVPIGSTFSVDTQGTVQRLTLPAVTSADNGARLRAVACVIDNASLPSDCVETAAATLTVVQSAVAPTFVQAPSAMLIRSGQTASFTVAAAGLPAPSLQWQTRAANATGAWANVSGGTGATTGNYTTPVLSTADNGTQYRVVASNASGSAASAAVTVSVSDLDVAPTITAQPAGLSVTAGNDAAFAIAARGTEALSYQWSKDGVPINGANSPVLRLAAVSVGQAGAYSVTVSNGAGFATSDVAVLSVSASAPAAVAPTIVTQPVSVLVNAGNTATFAVGASGSGTLSYQWLRNGQPIGGATAAFYSIAQAVVGDAATYAVQVSNGVGPSVTSFNVVLTVNQSVQPAAVAISVQPAPQVQTPGGSATFAVAASGSGPIGYQWLKNGTPIAGAINPVLTLSNVTGADMANYSVTVSNSLGSIDSAAASLTVLGAPAIVSQPANASVSEGGSATFNVSASGSGVLYQWTRNSVAIGGATSASYTTPALTLADSGAVYGVIVYNGAGLVFSQGAVLTVTALVAPSVTQQPANVTIEPGLPANLCMAFGGTPPFTVLMQRWDGTQWVTVGSFPISSTGQVCVSTPNLQLADNGAQFHFIANNGAVTGAMTNTVTVTVAVAAAPVSRLALVANSAANTLTILRADPSTGALTSIGTTGAGAFPYAVAITPNGLFAYVTNLVGNNVASYSIDTVTGAVASVGISVNSVNPYGIAMDPLGRFTWVANYSASTVSAYAINGATGQLAVVGSPVATGLLPYAVAAHPSGNHVYVANELGNSVSVFSVNTSTGALTLLAGTIVNSVYRPHAIAVDPSGRFVYVAESGGSSVAAFRVNASTGVLSAPTYANTGTSPTGVAVHPNGQFVYVTASNGVSTFSVNGSTGALTAIGSPIAAGSNPAGLAIDAAGAHLYVTDQGSNRASGFGIDATTGALTSLGAAASTGSGPIGIAITP